MPTVPAPRGPEPSGLGGIVRRWWVLAVLGLGTLVTALLGEEPYHFFTGEDRFCETLQVVFFALALFEAVRAQRRLAAAGRRVPATLYVVAVLGLFFLTGEELSWGQRFFHWRTPASLEAVNVQHETTVHNIEGVHQTVGFLLLAIGFWGSVLPALLRPGRWLGRWHEALAPYVPPERLAPYFLPMLVWRLYRNFFPLPHVPHVYAIVQLNEVLETAMAIGFWLFFRDRAREFAAGATATATVESS